MILLSVFAAMGVLTVPLQRQISLSRFQHFSFAVLAVGIGCLLQSVISWRSTTKWGRAALLSMTFYLCLFGYVCYINPWLDQSFDLQTALQAQQRLWFTIMFMIGGLPVGFFWYMWAVDRYQETVRKREQQGQTQENAAP
jgi:hypothetical protein